MEICILDDLDSFGPPFERYFLGSVERVPYFGPPPRGPASLNHRDPLIESFYMLQRTSLPILALYSGFEAYPSYVPNTDSTIYADDDESCQTRVGKTRSRSGAG